MHASSTITKRSCGTSSTHGHQRSTCLRVTARPKLQLPSRSAGTPAALGFGSAALWSGVALLGAYYLSKQMELEEQDRLETTSRRPCPSCGGSGYEACMCTRWSDGDVGCNTCSQTGYMKCRSCGGRGTAVPIKVTIRKDNL